MKVSRFNDIINSDNHCIKCAKTRCSYNRN